METIEILEFPFQGKIYSDLSRHDIRILILHLLYMLNANDYDVSLDSIVDNIYSGFDFDIPKDSYAFLTAQAISDNRQELDDQIQPLLKNWKINRLGLCTRLILQIALWELKFSETHPNIIINEAVELAKEFSERDAYKFVNGLLDQVAKNI
jgi:transcription antitermination protein NusB